VRTLCVSACLLGFTAGGLTACASPTLDGRLIDLTHPFDANTIFWPTETEGFVLDPVSAGETDGGYWYAANRFRSAEHGGTHLDAPFHFAREGSTVDAVPLERLIGPAVVVNATMHIDPDGAVNSSAVALHEGTVGTLTPDTIVLIHTGHGRHWDDRARYLGTERSGPEAVAELRFPGISPEVARLLVRAEVSAVGIDTPSIDPGSSKDFAAHRILAAAGIPVFENVANLDLLPRRGFSVAALPMKIRGGSGAPLRIVAIVPKGHR
jgi:kynurenine formamidase